jgi:hypothetical protein
MTPDMIREMFIIAGVNISLYLTASAYIDYKLSGDKNKKNKNV